MTHTCGFYPVHLYLGETYDRADQIIDAICCFSLAEIGLTEVTPETIATLARLDLADMLAAKNVIDLMNRMPVPAGAPRTIHVVPDDRLIAAVYTWLHYCAGDDTGRDNVVVRAPEGGSIRILASVTRTQVADRIRSAA